MDLQHEIVRQIRRELDIRLAGAEQAVKAQIRLHFTHVTTVAEVTGHAFTDEMPAVLHIRGQLPRRLPFSITEYNRCNTLYSEG